MILPSVKDDKTKRWNKVMIKKNKVRISFEDIYAEFPFDVIFASAFSVSQANLKVKLQINKLVKTCTGDGIFNFLSNAAALDFDLLMRFFFEISTCRHFPV